jgi:Ca2+-transporting ATPase
MKRGAAPPDESVLGASLGRHIVVSGVLIATVTLLAGVMADVRGEPVQSTVFAVIGMAQLALAIALRAPRQRWQRTGRVLEAAVVGAAALQIAAVYTPLLRDLLHTSPISGQMSALCIGLAVVPALAARISLRPGRGVVR